MTQKNETDFPFSEPHSTPIQSLDDAILFEVVEPEQRGDKVVSGRGVYIIPNLITTLSLFSAFASILASFNGEFKLAIGLIFASGFLDGIDGRLARMLGAQSRFGEEFDSLADLLAFGAAPAFLVYSWTLSELGRFGMGVSFIFLAFAAFRLARFNTQIGSGNKKYFVGLASPLAAIMVTSLVMLGVDRPDWININLVWVQVLIALWTLIAAVLMISGVRYFSFKELDSKRAPVWVLFLFVITLAVVLVDLPIGIMLLVLGYVGSGVYSTMVYRRELKANQNGASA